VDLAMSDAINAALRKLPSVGAVLDAPAVAALQDRFGPRLTRFVVRRFLDELREDVRAGRRGDVPGLDQLAEEVHVRLTRLALPLGRRAINATGILLHTGLGRAPLADDAAAAIADCVHYTILQTDIETGRRSLREAKIEAMLRELTGCEAATVVNNNAAATMLVLHTLAHGKEVIVSRGQLVEIGGSYRLPDVLAASGATLREIGTTNRTHLRDYRAAINENTGAIIHVHTSNYRIRGFASTPPIQELAPLGREHGIPVIDDLGSGALVPLREFGLPDEPLVGESIAAGADVLCFSGDKLICGPQAGMILGRTDVIGRIRKNPFARMFRCDKMTLAGVEATLPHFINGDFRHTIPLYRMLARETADLEAEAQALARTLAEVPGLDADVVDDLAYIGSGSIPDEGIPGKAVSLRVDVPAEELARRLRRGLPSVFGRVHQDRVLLHMRTLLDGERDLLADGVRNAVGEANA
jgi:L-seryl-tRNA(Ser) seleniumtransferase